MAVAGPKRKRSKTSSGWSWRLAGIALCAFFALGVITGLSQSGRVLERRIEALLERLPHSSRSDLIPAAYHALFFKEPTAGKFGGLPAALTIGGPAEAIALVEHPDGFFQIDSEGSLRGPVSPADAADLPVLSGSGVENARASQLVEYAGRLIRAEAALSTIISEMHVTSSGEMHLFLDRPHLVIVLAPGQFPLQLVRAAKVLEVWRGHHEFIGMIDMTVPGEAIMRPQAETMERLDRANTSAGVSRPG
ncbi:MAG: cell division protein FtsQ/DivIB [Deltaproteobacteria bacterium]|nr:cell division protein FtsQ/DivIB [Deltaproteobacteria bacterium]